MNAPYRLKKHLGQHFLHNDAISSEIVGFITRRPGLQLLEIGPGGGALTRYLAGWEQVDFKAIEVDPEKVAFLTGTFPRLRLIEGDFLKSPAPFEGPFSIIGNFPYNISSLILFRVLEWEPQVEEVVGMFQKEVALRVASPEGNKNYGILSVLIQAFFEVEYLLDVAPENFTPPPKVDSGVIRLRNTHNPHGIDDPKVFKRLVKAAFNQRRKTLRNALKGTLLPEQLQDEVFSQRAEQLSVADFVAVYKTYCKAG